MPDSQKPRAAKRSIEPTPTRPGRPAVLAELDAQLGETRGPNGEPSSSDFLLLDLPSIADKFAESFDELPAMYAGREDYRYLVTTGSLIAAAVVIGQLGADGSIVLFGIEIDRL